ncbi:hypothetical protein CSA56_04825 [candidate division KSB3 bacterium]|uniref:Uncharacterized protein n=1 Tax=candidate division KSB3 bacterium TaxID=2044937 RepID=A0A2G6KI01_9BACT|nr:MAG: hypothetical protein CSA56_04825 [candidate division KSB3 bacterium]
MEITLTALEKRIKRHVRAKKHTFYAIVPPGFEEAACQELADYEISSQQKDRGGVVFSGKWEDCWKAHHRARIPARLLVRLTKFSSSRFDQLEKALEDFPWELWLQPHLPVAFHVDAQQSTLYHEGAIQERAERCIEKRLHSWQFVVPKPESSRGTQTVFLRNFRNQITVSLDCSGGLLYKRGYDKHVDSAPLRDNIAAAILREANFSRFDTLIDPMAGSGTFGLEALLGLSKYGAGHFRHFAFELFPVFRSAAYQYFLKTQTEARLKQSTLRSIILCDSQKRPITIMHHNLQQLAAADIDTDSVKVGQSDFFQVKGEFISGKTLVCLNPPYGTRLKATQNTRNFFGKLGQHLRKGWRGCSFAIIAPGEDAERALSLPVSKKILFYNGGISTAVIMGTIR